FTGNLSEDDWSTCTVRWESFYSPDVGRMMESLSTVCDHARRSILRSYRVFNNPSMKLHAIFVLDWNASEFLKQQYSNSSKDSLATAITITGSLHSAVASTTAEYLKQNWPNSTTAILRLFRDPQNSPKTTSTANHHLGPGSKDFPGPVTQSIVIKSRPGQTLVSITGPERFIREVTEQLSWIGSALRESSSDGLTQCSPFFSYLKREDHRLDSQEWWSVSGFSRNTWDIYGRISFAVQEPHQVPKPQEGTCWHGLFRSPVIAHGDPHSNCEGHLGLKIPLDMLARSIGTSRAMEFEGGLLLKGFSAILFPTRLVDDTITWHLVFNEDGSHISFLDERVRKIQADQTRKITLADLQSVKTHVVGWCPTAKSFAGYPSADYPVAPSGCPERIANVRVEKLGISAGQYITGSATISPGERAAPLLKNSATDSYQMNVMFISEKLVLLYDVGEQRGWLVNGATAVLHLVVASWKYLLSTEVESTVLSKVEALSLDQTHSARSAVKILLGKDNMELPILPGHTKEEKYTFRQEVERAMLLLEQAFTYQELEQYKPGFELKNPFTTDRLAGFDFAEVSKPVFSPRRRFAELQVASRGWAKVIKKSKTVVLFGKGFGNLIEPADRQCDAWSSVPTGQGYIASRIEDLEWIKSDAEIMNEVIGHQPGQLFKCSCK
ncbi:hypothetical protein HDK77DRAFT_363620, partial [Phyllosticta capitalensis]